MVVFFHIQRKYKLFEFNHPGASPGVVFVYLSVALTIGKYTIIPDLRSTSAGNDIFYSENIFRFLGKIENKIALDLGKSRAVSGL